MNNDLNMNKIDDTISRHAAIEALETVEYDFSESELSEVELEEVCGAVGDVRQDMIGRIKQLPPAQPEIIRCKDCKHWIPYDWMFSEVWQSKNMSDYPEDEIGCDCCDMAMKANDFCSRGERREVIE